MFSANLYRPQEGWTTYMDSTCLIMSVMHISSTNADSANPSPAPSKTSRPLSSVSPPKYATRYTTTSTTAQRSTTHPWNTATTITAGRHCLVQELTYTYVSVGIALSTYILHTPHTYVSFLRVKRRDICTVVIILTSVLLTCS
jgi:hypothetical protein